jgi:hypothetical protein
MMQNPDAPPSSPYIRRNVQYMSMFRTPKLERTMFMHNKQLGIRAYLQNPSNLGISRGHNRQHLNQPTKERDPSRHLKARTSIQCS